jgi:mannose-6-phosphate isomerase class I
MLSSQDAPRRAPGGPKHHAAPITLSDRAAAPREEVHPVTPALLELRCGIQHYAWGDTRFIPHLLGIDNAADEPYAELWMGAHPDLPAEAVIDGKPVPLDELIAARPEEILGPAAVAAFDGRLPYLFKVLSARSPLSIQTHPSAEAARAGFAREHAAGIPLSAPHRNYRDEQPKEELIAALTDLYALRGFRPLAEIAALGADVPELASVLHGFRPTPDGLRALYGALMVLPQNDVDAILDPLVARLRAADEEAPFTRHDHAFWLLAADRLYARNGHHDRGLLSVYLLNLIHLAPGEALYLPSGVLHAYLAGAGMEIMTNSNNVLRGGLTGKHVDVPELIANVTFEGDAPQIVRPAPGAAGVGIYATPTRAFELHRIDVDGSHHHERAVAHGADILFVTDGDEAVTVTADAGALELPRGGALLAPHAVGYAVTATAPATIYRATVPG